MHEVVPSAKGARSSAEPDLAHARSRNGSRQRSELAALYLKVANTLQRSAELAEKHAERERGNGRGQSASIELERADRAREAARRGRALASRLG